MDDTRIEKKISWSCARLTFSILLQDKSVDDATVAYLMGHKTTEQVRKTYKRHRPKDKRETIAKLPNSTNLAYNLYVQDKSNSNEYIPWLLSANSDPDTSSSNPTN